MLPPEYLVLHRWIRQIKKWLGERRGVSPPVMLVTGGLASRRSPRRRLYLEPLEDRINPNATLNILGSGLQILIAGPDTVNLSTVNGALVVNDSTAGQTITDTTGKFTVAGAAGNQTATENASLVVDFTSLTITGTGGGQTVNFTGGSFVATNVNDGTIPTVGFANALSSFSGDLNIVTSASLTVSAPISGMNAVLITVGGTNAPLNVNANITGQNGPVTLQASGAVTVGAGVAIVSAIDSLTLGADLTPAGAGDDGVGTLTVGNGASLYGLSVTLRGADEDISPTASVGTAIANESAASTFVDNSQGLSGGGPLAFDASGNLYVANNFGNTIQKVTPGGVVSTFASLPSNSFPDGLAFDAAGNLYVANQGPGLISKITQAGTISTFVQGITGAGGLAFDASGNLYVTTGNTVSKITPAGSVSTFVTGLSGPESLAFDSSGNLYISNLVVQNTVGTITKVTPGGVVSTFVNVSQGLLNPRSLAFDGSGNLYVLSAGIQNAYPSFIQKITPAGVATNFIVYSNQLFFPNCLAFDNSGNLFVADPNAGTIDKINVIPMPISATTSQITIRSSVSSRPMSLGGSNNAAVTGINLTSAEMAAIGTTAIGTVTFGDSNQTGNIIIATATLATTAGAGTLVVQSPSGGGQIILDDGGGSSCPQWEWRRYKNDRRHGRYQRRERK